MKCVPIAAVLVTTMLPEASALELTIELTGLENNNGSLLYAVYADEESFLSGADTALANGFLPLSDKSETPEITVSLDPGQYAVAVFHDENANGKLDTGAFSIPVEGYGFSQNPNTNTAPPSFSETRVVLDESDKTIEVQLKY